MKPCMCALVCLLVAASPAAAQQRTLVLEGGTVMTITDDQLRAVIEKATGLRVLGHTQNIRKAVAMGMKHMEHMDT